VPGEPPILRGRRALASRAIAPRGRASALFGLLGALGLLFPPARAESPVIGAPLRRPLETADGILLGPVLFSPSIGVTQTWDSNVFRIGDNAEFAGVPVPIVSDTLTTATGRLAFTLPISHSFLSLVWYPGYRNYGTINLAKTTSNQLVFESRFMLSNGSIIDFIDAAAEGYLDTSEFDPGGVLTFSSSPYKRNSPVLTVDWPLGPRWGLLGTLSEVRYVFDAAINPAAQVAGIETKPRVDFYDFTTDTVEVGGYHTLRQMRVFGALRLATTDQNRTKFNETHDLPPSAVSYETITEGQASVGVQGNLSSSMSGTLSVGYTSWKFKNSGAAPFSGISVAGNLNRQFGLRTAGNLVLFRGPQQATGDNIGYYLREEAYANVERWFGTRLVAHLGLQFRRNTFFKTIEGAACDLPTEQLPLGCLQYYTLDLNPIAQIEYRINGNKLNNPLVLGLTYNMEHRTSDQPVLDMNDRRITLVLAAGWF
jgi:hypothetical protein